MQLTLVKDGIFLIGGLLQVLGANSSLMARQTREQHGARWRAGRAGVKLAHNGAICRNFVDVGCANDAAKCANIRPA